MLPGGNGLEVCRTLKSNALTAKKPVVIMTANSRIEIMKEECTAEDFMVTPFGIIDLAKRVSFQANKAQYIFI